jgi:hypothetical protein
MARLRRISYLQAPVLFAGGIVRQSLISWLQVDPLTSFFKVVAGTITPTNHGLTYAEGWLVGDGAAAYASFLKPAAITDEVTFAVYLNPILSVKHQAVTDAYMSVIDMGTVSAGMMMRTGAVGAAAYFVEVHSNNAGAGYFVSDWLAPSRLTGPTLLHATITPTTLNLYSGKTLVKSTTNGAGSGNIAGGAASTYILARPDGSRWSEMGVRDILIYNRALSAGEVAKNVQEFHL